ncbi:putative clathrin assembly protein At5g35200 [Coffea eugenioides]|uniref:putative clathrin assembly protein At5g35200 n=1 Tax=Coffea eugenioides TaxID=49369 RepID=UPI000F60E15F|nr:putative clathrin assembly protein At5g35200 [Coffea eugenioides]
MTSGNVTSQNFRKAFGALKDSTKVGMAIVNSENKELDVAIVKATNHDEVLPKQKHVRTIFNSLSASSPREDVSYCIHALARRLAKTHTWTVALKTLVVIHRGLREVDATFQQELIEYGYRKNHLLNLSHFKDDSSPSAWENSSWVRCYALYLEELLECFRVLKYDFQKDRSRIKALDTSDLLEQLPVLQQLLFRLLDCQPVGASQPNFLIQYALSIVAAESVRLYVIITDGTLNLVDKFFEMQRHDAVRSLEIYKKAGKQAKRLSAFFELCRSLDFGRGQNYIEIKQPAESFMTIMEEYVKDAPQTLMLPWRVGDNDKVRTPKATIAVDSSLDINHELGDGAENCSDPSVVSDKVSKNENTESSATPPVADLLSFDDLFPEASPMEGTDSAPSAIIRPGDQLNTSLNPDLISQSTSWELELVSASSSNLAVVTASTLGGGLDRLTLDSLYDVALAIANPSGMNQVSGISSNPFEDASYELAQYPHHVAQSIEPPSEAHTSDMAQKQEVYMQQEQQVMVVHESSHPFGHPFVDQGTACPSQNQSLHASSI